AAWTTCPRSQTRIASRRSACSPICRPSAARRSCASKPAKAASNWRNDCATLWGRTSMRVEAVTAPSAPATPAPQAPQAPALTRRASLNAVQALLDYGGKLLVGFVVTPLLVTGLGASLYGVREILSRLIGYITAADARPTEALRLVIATRQGLNDPAGDRRAVGSALLVWLIFLPLVI